MPRKKKKPKRQSRPRGAWLPVPPRFAIGSPVRVRAGITDPDFPELSLAGWAGIVDEVNLEPTPRAYLVWWDQATLDRIPPSHHTRCQHHDLEVECMWLNEDELEANPSTPVASKPQLPSLPVPARLDDQEARIRLALGLSSDEPLPPVNPSNLSTYHAYLTRHLKLPFSAWFEEETATDGRRRIPITVLSLLHPEESVGHPGLACAVMQDRELFAISLAAIEVSSTGVNQQLVEDYRCWFREDATSDNSPDYFRSLAGSDELALEPASLRVLVRTLAFIGLLGLFYGASLGAAVNALEGAAQAARIGAISAAIAGGLLGAFFGHLFGTAHHLPGGKWVGGSLGVILGGLSGGLLGTILLTLLESFLGGLGGWLAGRLIKWKRTESWAPLLGLLSGVLLGVGYQAWGQNPGDAWTGTWIGGLVGALSGPGLLVAGVFLFTLLSQYRSRTP